MSGFLSRVRQGLSRSTAKLTESVAAAVTKRRLDDEALEELEEALITADLGTEVARGIVGEFRRTRFGREAEPAEIRAALATEIAAILRPVAIPLRVDLNRHPHVVLMVGVNGTGKTTTIGKLAALYTRMGFKCVMAAGDTFRAAAVEQLQIWGQRSGTPVIAGPPNSDAASLAFEALDRAIADQANLLFIDTAGRLHNKGALMEELSKIIRVIQKRDPSAPHSIILTLDATTGQNAIEQVRVFREIVAITGLIVTKLDGSARGGIVVALAEKFGLPVHAVGVGEQADDLRPFDADEFAQGLAGA